MLEGCAAALEQLHEGLLPGALALDAQLFPFLLPSLQYAFEEQKFVHAQRSDEANRIGETHVVTSS